MQPTDTVFSKPVAKWRCLPHRRGWAAGTLLALVYGLTGSGCSVLGFVYERADWFGVRYAERYVSFDDTQRQALRAALRARLETHRREELPGLVEFLRRCERSLAGGLSAAEMRQGIAELRAVYEETVRRTLPYISPTLATLSEAQIDELASNMAERNEAYRETHLADDTHERRLQRLERFERRIEWLTGELAEAQLELLAQRLRATPDLTLPWFQYRLRKQAAFLMLLAEAPEPRRIEAFLANWLTEQSDLTPDTRLPSEQALDRIADLLAELYTTLSERQRAAALEKVRGYRTLLEKAALDEEDGVDTDGPADQPTGTPVRR